MKEDQLLPSDRNLYRSTRPVLLLLVAALVGFVTTNSAVFGQKQDLCQNNKTQLAELEKQAQTLQKELSFKNDTEDDARRFLSALNKALVDPHSSEPGHFVRIYLPTPAARQMAVESWGDGLPWKDEYLDDDALLLRALRDAGIRRVVRVKYVLTHKAEIQQQKANADEQIAYHRNRLAELHCGESSASPTELSVVGTWTWAFGPTGKAEEHGTVTFTKDEEKQEMTWSGGSRGTWTQSGSIVTLRWLDKTITDTMTLSENGETLKGTNTKGLDVIGTRK